MNIKMKGISRKKSKGFLEISTGAVLLVVGLLSIVGLGIASEMRESGAASATLTKTISTVDKTRKKYNRAPSFNGLNNAQAIVGKLIPLDWVVGTAILNDSDGVITFSAEDCLGTDDCFGFAQTRFSETGCSDYVNNMFDTSWEIEVDGAKVKAAGAGTIAVATLNAACTGASNTVKTYHRRS